MITLSFIFQLVLQLIFQLIHLFSNCTLSRLG
jgi:hypothetical protein